MNEIKFTLDELTQEVNNQLEMTDLIATDSRQSKVLSARRIRDLVGKDLISKPIRDGRTVYYTQLHLNELIEFRKLQSKGLSEKSLLSFKEEQPEYDMFGNDEHQNEDVALDSENTLGDLIYSMKNEQNPVISKNLDLFNSSVQNLKSDSLLNTLSSYCGSSKLNVEDPLSSFKSGGSLDKLLEESEKENESKELRSLSFNSIEKETWNEYKLSDNTILKVRSGTELDDLHTLIEQLKKVSNQIKNK